MSIHAFNAHVHLHMNHPPAQLASPPFLLPLPLELAHPPSLAMSLQQDGMPVMSHHKASRTGQQDRSCVLANLIYGRVDFFAERLVTT